MDVLRVLGQRQRVLIAQVLARGGDCCCSTRAAPVVGTHVTEVAAASDYATLLAQRVVAFGRGREVLTAEALLSTFGLVVRYASGSALRIGKGDGLRARGRPPSSRPRCRAVAQDRRDLPATPAALAGLSKTPPGRLSLRAMWTRFLFRWAAFFGFIVSASNCPFCGRPGCPQGIASAGIMAGVIVAMMNGLRRSRGASGRAMSPTSGTVRGASG